MTLIKMLLTRVAIYYCTIVKGIKMKLRQRSRAKRAAAKYATLASLVLLSVTSQAGLIDRGNGLIYDDVLDVTWMQDANYMQTSGFNSDGNATFSTAQAWVNNLTFQGYDDWRLPTIMPLNGSSYEIGFSFDGSTDRGFNSDTSVNELAHMFYNNLGNVSYFDTNGNGMQPGSESYSSSFIDAETGMMKIFENINVSNWFGLENDPVINAAWAYNNRVNNIATGETQLLSTATLIGSWVLRNGDVRPVVEPPTPPSSVSSSGGIELFGIGLIGLLGTRLRAFA